MFRHFGVTGVAFVEPIKFSNVSIINDPLEDVVI
jgi:hypothetical protein